MSDPLNVQKQGQRLENQFFAKLDQRLIEQLQERISAQSTAEDLQAATGIDDERLLQDLVTAGVTANSLSALRLVPVVLVAWADGRLDRREREKVLDIARDHQLSLDDDAHQLLIGWLEENPTDQLLPLWKDYCQGLAQTLPERALASLRQTIMAEAREVAKAAGGLLGIGAVSPGESQMIQTIENALKSTA
jgi:tellurite resistance protein